MLGRGKYSISEPYKKYQVEEEKYYQMKKQQKSNMRADFLIRQLKISKRKC